MESHDALILGVLFLLLAGQGEGAWAYVIAAFWGVITIALVVLGWL